MRSQVTWPTIPAMVRDAARRNGSAEAVVDGGRRVDFTALSAMVTGAARALLAVDDANQNEQAPEFALARDGWQTLSRLAFFATAAFVAWLRFGP